MRLTGSNFTDLAVALWQETCRTGDRLAQREFLRRIARAMAAGYADQIQGNTPAERMKSLADLLAQRRIPVSVEESSQGTVLTQHACPYPKLSEQDSSVCNMERMMFSELLGQEVRLTECRREGGGECRFQAT
jgi:predicted ArsR family transcriptional regulator